MDKGQPHPDSGGWSQTSREPYQRGWHMAPPIIALGQDHIRIALGFASGPVLSRTVLFTRSAGAQAIIVSVL